MEVTASTLSLGKMRKWISKGLLGIHIPSATWHRIHLSNDNTELYEGAFFVSPSTA